MVMKVKLYTALFIVAPGMALAQEPKEKHHEDPTKVITKMGFGYTDDFTISGSLALDSIKKINGKINSDGSEWRLGGSWLFNFGILNFSMSRSEYDNGGDKTSYSIGTFAPLSAFDVDTGSWMVFPMAGISHNATETFQTEDIQLYNDVIMVQNTSNGGYIGAMALRPLSETWTIIAFTGAGLGSDDYSNFWAGAGASYKINKHHSFNFFGFASEDSFGSVSKLSASYTYEFK